MTLYKEGAGTHVATSAETSVGTRSELYLCSHLAFSSGF